MGAGQGGDDGDSGATLVQKTQGVVTRTVLTTQVEYQVQTVTTTILPESCRETVTSISVITLLPPGIEAPPGTEVVQEPVPVFITAR